VSSAAFFGTRLRPETKQGFLILQLKTKAKNGGLAAAVLFARPQGKQDDGNFGN
jgi:hypothetical protein